MRLAPTVLRVLALTSFSFILVILAMFLGGFAPTADTKTAGTLGLSSVTKSVAEVPGMSDGDGKADAGETLEYSISITGNASPTTGVVLTDTLSDLTTLSGTANILPIVKGDSFTAVGNTLLVVPDGVGDLLANDLDLDGGTIEIDGFGVNASVTSAPGETLTIDNGGSLTVRADGSFEYDPPKGLNTAGTFYYRAKDGQGGTGTAQVSLTTEGMVWYVNPAAAADGDGRFTSPFRNLSTFNAANTNAGDSVPQNSDTIFLYSGAHTGPLTLRPGQKLIGQGASASIPAITGYPVPSGTSQLPLTAGIAPTITSSGVGITLSNNVTIRGITIGNTTGAKISGSNFGTLAVGSSSAPDVALSGTGQALNLSTGSFDAGSGFSSVATTSSTAQGISLVGITGAVTFGSTAVSGSTSQGIFVNQTTANISFGNTNISGGTDGISLQNNSAGTRTFGTITRTGGSGVAFLHAAGGGSTNVSGAATIIDPAGIGVSVDASNANLTFAGLTVNKSSTAGAGVNIVNSTGRTFSFGTLAITTSNGAGIVTNGSGTVSSTGGSISASGSGTGVAGSFANTAVSLVFTSVSSNGGSNGLLIGSGTTGSFSSGTTNLQNNTSVGLSMSGSAVAASFGNTTVNSSGNTAVVLATNTGAITFADLDLTPDAGFRALDAQNNTGRITSASGDITTSNAAAVYITGPGGRTPLNMSLTAVNSNGGSNGIYITNTSSGGSPGGFRVLGNSAGICGGISNPTGSATPPSAGDCTGGTIQNMTGADGSAAGNGIYLSNVENVSFTRIRVNDHANNGIFGTGVRGLSIASSLFNGNNGNSNSGTFDESAINTTDLGGAVSITNSFISGGAFNNLRIENIAGTAPNLTLTLSGNTSGTMQGSTADVRSTAFLVHAMDGTSASQIHNNRLTFWWGNAIHVLVQGTASGTSNITGNFADNTNGALAGAGGIWVAGGTLTYNISNNIVRHTNGTAISADRGNFGSTMQGTIENNAIGVSGDANSGSATGTGIFASHHGPGTTTVRINNNVLRQINGSANGAIWTLSGDALGFNGSGTLNATITNNSIQESGTTINNAQHGILITHGTQSGPPTDTDQGCYDILNNTIVNFVSGTANNRIRVNQRFGTTSRFPGYTGTPTGGSSTSELGTYLLSRNTASTAQNANTSTGGFLNTSPPGSPCPQPASPPSAIVENDLLGEQASLTDSYGSGLIAAEYSGHSGDEEQTGITAANVFGAAGLGNEAAPVSTSRDASVSRILSEFAGKLSEMVSPTAQAATPAGVADVQKGPFTLPGNETVTIRFRVTVNDGPYAAGANDVLNTANVTADGGINLDSNTTSMPLDAAPDLSLTVSDANSTTEPSKTASFTINYANGNDANGQGAIGVVVTQAVPANSVFNAAASEAGWSCANGAPSGTVCQYTVGAVAVNTSESIVFAVDVLPALPAGVISITTSASIADDGANGTDLDPADNTSALETTPIIGNWLGAASADWHAAANWSNGTVPPAGNNISVPNVANRPAVLTQDAAVGTLTLADDIEIAAGRTVAASGEVALGTNAVNGDGTLELSASAGITRTTGQVNSTLRKNFAVTGLFLFPVGTGSSGNEYSPLQVNVTSGSGTLTVRANKGTVTVTPAIDPSKTLQRYWTLEGNGITADLTFNYLDGDVAGDESNYKLMKVSGGLRTTYANTAECPASGSPCVDSGANTMFISGVTSFSDWTASELEPQVPTAAPASIMGRVLGPTGRSNGRATVTITDEFGNVRQVRVSSFGYFEFPEVPAGQTFILTVKDKRYRYESSLLNVQDSISGLVLTPMQ